MTMRNDVCCPSPRSRDFLLISSKVYPSCFCEKHRTILCIMFTHVSVTPADKCPLKPRVEPRFLGAVLRERGRRMRERGQAKSGWRNGAQAEGKTIDDSKPSRVYQSPTETSTCAVFVGCLTTVNGPWPQPRRCEKKVHPMDILMPLCVCVFGMSRFIADSNRSRADRCGAAAMTALHRAPRRYGNAVSGLSGRVTELLGDDSNRGA